MAYAPSYTGDAFAGDLSRLFRYQLEACALSPGEFCVCVTDTAWMPAYAAACHAAALSLGAEAFVATFAWDRRRPPSRDARTSPCPAPAARSPRASTSRPTRPRPRRCSCGCTAAGT